MVSSFDRDSVVWMICSRISAGGLVVWCSCLLAGGFLFFLIVVRIFWGCFVVVGAFGFVLLWIWSVWAVLWGVM